MADIADMMIQQGFKTAGEVNNIGDDMMKGAQLAQTIQQTQLQRQAIEKAKADQETAKLEKVGEWINTAAKMPDGRSKQAFMKNFIPNGIKAFGLQDKIDPTVFEMIQGDPNLGSFLVGQIREGNVDLSALTNPETVAGLAASPQYAQFGGAEAIKNAVEDYRPKIEEADKDRVQQAATKTNAEIQAQSQANRAIADDNREPEKQRKIKIAKDHATFEGAGGFAKLNTQLAKLKKVRADLESGKLKTGPSVSNLVGGKTQTALNPEVASAQGLVRSSIDLKKALDSSFSDAAAAQAYSQTFDALLPTEKNKEKIDFLIKDLENNKRIQKKNFQREKLPIDDPMDKLSEQKRAQFSKLSPAGQKAALPGLAKALNMDLNDLAAELGVK